MKRTILSGAAIGLVAASLPSGATAQTQGGARPTWEYAIVKEDNNTAGKQLNDAGALGWELVNVVCTNAEVTTYGSSSVGGGGTDACWYYFKRRK